MLHGQSIICFAHDWNGDPTSKTHIMRLLAWRNKVLWVNSIGMRRPTASAYDLRRIGSKLRRGLGASRAAQPNLWVVHPLVLPLPGVALAERFNAAFLGARLRRLCRRHGMHAPILWSFMPNVGRLVGRLGESLVVYHCVDEYAAFSGVRRETLARMERELIRRADLVLTSAEQLRDERRELNPHVHFIPHGVDVLHFARALEPGVVPPDMSTLPAPIVGFFGLLADWIDIDLLREVARARPRWSIVLIGRSVTDLRGLAGLPNVHLLGHRPYAALPDYCRGFDVGIVPFRTNDLTVRANPLKLREYLAAGLPVVSTPLPEVARYERWVRLAGDPAAFVDAIERALPERTSRLDRQRLEAMRFESWSARVEQMSARVEERLAARSRTTVPLSIPRPEVLDVAR